MTGERNAKEQLASFIAKFDPEVARLAEAILCRMRLLFPTALELVYDNYNALAIALLPPNGPPRRSSRLRFIQNG